MAVRKRKSARFVPTAHHTTGPFFPAQFIRAGDNDLTRRGGEDPLAAGERIAISGRVLDINGTPGVNVIIEIWQADAQGRFPHPADTRPGPAPDPNFKNWGRTWTDKEGRFRFVTVKPGGYPAPDGGNWWRAPHVNVMIIGAGMMRPVVTQIFFPDEALNADDPQLALVPTAKARARLIAQPDAAADGLRSYRFDIVLAGRNQTPFFAD